MNSFSFFIKFIIKLLKCIFIGTVLKTVWLKSSSVLTLDSFLPVTLILIDLNSSKLLKMTQRLKKTFMKISVYPEQFLRDFWHDLVFRMIYFLNSYSDYRGVNKFRPYKSLLYGLTDFQ